MPDQPVSAPATFDIGDLTSLPDQATGTATKTFSAAGRDWQVTVRTNVTANPENMYAIVRMLSKTDGVPRTIVVPGVPPFELRDAKYVGMLSALAAISVEPAWNGLDGVDRWALFARKVGGPVIDQILSWALDASGLSTKAATQEQAAAGEATAQAE